MAESGEKAISINWSEVLYVLRDGTDVAVVFNLIDPKTNSPHVMAIAAPSEEDAKRMYDSMQASANQRWGGNG